MGGSSSTAAAGTTGSTGSPRCRATRARISASRFWNPSSSVRKSQPTACFVAPERNGRATVRIRRVRSSRPFLLGLCGVGGEVALQHGANAGAVVPELAERLVDLLGEHRLGQGLGCAPDGSPGRPEEPLRPAKHEEAGATDDGGGASRVAPDLGGHVDCGASGGFENLQLLAERLARR